MLEFLNEAVEKERYFVMYDCLIEKVKQVADNNAKLKELEKIIAKIIAKNQNVLLSNHVGERILINDMEIKDVFDIFDLTEREVRNYFDQSPRYKGAIGLINQFLFICPLILLTGELLNVGKKEFAENIYLFTYIRPYASAVFRFFPYGLSNPDQMEWTINNMDNKFYIKKYERIFDTITQMSLESLSNYHDKNKWIGSRISDDQLWDIYVSGILTRVNSMVKKIRNEFSKNSNKYLQYQHDIIVKDDEGDDVAIESGKNISAQKQNSLKLAVNMFTIDPVDDNLINIAVKKEFAHYGGTNRFNLDTLKSAIEKSKDIKYKEVCELISFMLSMWFSTKNPETNRSTTMSEIGSVTFLVSMRRIFTSPNTHDTNLLAAKDLLNDILSACSERYMVESQKEYKTILNAIKTAYYFYICLLIQKAIKNR